MARGLVDFIRVATGFNIVQSPFLAMATFHELSRLDCRGLLSTVAQYLFRNKVGGKWLSFRFLDADLPPTASKRYDFVKD